MRNPFRSRVKTPAVDPDIQLTAEIIYYLNTQLSILRDLDQQDSADYLVAMMCRDEELENLSALFDHKMRSGVYA